MQTTHPVDVYSDKYAVFHGLMSPRLRLAWDIGIATGLRVTDIISLKRDQVEYGVTQVKEKKTGKTRFVVIPHDLVTQLHHAADYHKSQWCFPSPKSNRRHIHRDTLGKEIRHIAKRAGYQDVVSMHSARKTFALNMWKTCGNYVDVQKTLNHEHLATTLLYIHGAEVV